MSLADDLLNAVFNGTSYASPDNLYLGLFTASGEVDGGSYARVIMTGKFSAATNAITSNAVQVAFPKPTLDWGVVTHVGIFDAEVGGDALITSQLAKAETITTSADVFFNAGQLQFGVTI